MGYILFFLGAVFLFTSAGISTANIDRPNQDSAEIIIEGPNVVVRKQRDRRTNTVYYLTRIKHKDKKGRLLKLRQSLAASDSGETVTNFYERIGNPLFAINCSTVRSNATSTRAVSRLLIIDGQMVTDRTASNRFTLGIKKNNLLLAYDPGTTAQEILEDGTRNAVTAFTPLIINHRPVPDEILKMVKNYAKENPRQVIAQFDNMDLLILSCGGRGYEGKGLKARDVIRILQELKDTVRFAYNLDGGVSTTTVVKGQLITPKIDGHGTKLRMRASFLYVQPNE